MARIRQVRESDGTLSPYRERKVAEAVLQALRESGTDDRGLAEELAGVVSLFLERTHPEPETPPKISDVTETVGRVLRETGNEAAARRFERTLEARQQIRHQLVVRTTKERRAEDIRLSAEIADDSASAKWSRTRLLRSLVEGAELPSALAEEIAAAVEAKVFRLELKSITGGFLRHLVACELFERGIGDGGLGAERLPIAASALTGWLLDADADERDAVTRIAAPLLEHFALSEIHGPGVADAHAEGILHVHGLDQPLAIERLELPLAIVPGALPWRPASWMRLRTAIEALGAHVRGTIVLPDVFAHAVLDSNDGVAAVDGLVDAVARTDALGRPSGPRIEIAVPLAQQAARGGGSSLAAAVSRLVERATAAGAAIALQFVVDERLASDPTASVVAFAFVRSNASASVTWARDAQADTTLAFSLGRVTLNVPLLLMRAAGDGLKHALGHLERGGRLARDAFQERAFAQRRTTSSGLAAILAFLGGPARVSVPAAGSEVDVEVWGLNRAIDLLAKRVLVARAAAPDAVARILGSIHYQLGEERDGLQFLVRMGGCVTSSVRKRLFQAATLHAARLGIADLAAGLKDDGGREGVLPLAIPLADPRNHALLSSRAFHRVGPGLALAEACLPGGLSVESLAALRTSSKLSAVFLAAPGASGLFEVQEELFG